MVTGIMSNKDTMDQSIRVITFSGKQRDWSHWEEKILARAKRKGLKELYLGKNGIVIPKESEQLVQGKDDDKIKIRENNEIAYGE